MVVAQPSALISSWQATRSWAVACTDSSIQRQRGTLPTSKLSSPSREAEEQKMLLVSVSLTTVLSLRATGPRSAPTLTVARSLESALLTSLVSSAQILRSKKGTTLTAPSRLLKCWTCLIMVDSKCRRTPKILQSKSLALSRWWRRYLVIIIRLLLKWPRSLWWLENWQASKRMRAVLNITAGRCITCLQRTMASSRTTASSRTINPQSCFLRADKRWMTTKNIWRELRIKTWIWQVILSPIRSCPTTTRTNDRWTWKWSILNSIISIN